MPKRTDLQSILIIGAGPIVIGQACEFDYSGAQACKALREEGYRVILVNSNPATIMTDPETADAIKAPQSASFALPGSTISSLCAWTSIDGCDRKADTLRSSIGRPPIDSSCLGRAPPSR